MKILVIDDEKPTLSMFKLFLTAYGYEVFTAEDGEKGLALFNEISPEIVFTDIKMPGMDGLEVLRRIQQTDINTQVIVITGHGDIEKAVDALDLNASDFINKPVERQALNSSLARAEKRIKMPRDMPFKLSKSKKETHSEVLLGGKLGLKAKETFHSIFEADHMKGVKEVSLIFGDDFSINRAGISLLMEVIQHLKQKEILISMENLSYNYTKVFEMVGIDKIATITKTNVSDQD
jgi:CheY-like chemotaxis protein